MAIESVVERQHDRTVGESVVHLLDERFFTEGVEVVVHHEDAVVLVRLEHQDVVVFYGEVVTRRHTVV